MISTYLMITTSLLFSITLLQLCQYLQIFIIFKPFLIKPKKGEGVYETVIQILSVLTLLWRAEAAVPRHAGSKASSWVKRPNEESGQSLKVSSKLGL